MDADSSYSRCPYENPLPRLYITEEFNQFLKTSRKNELRKRKIEIDILCEDYKCKRFKANFAIAQYNPSPLPLLAASNLTSSFFLSYVFSKFQFSLNRSQLVVTKKDKRSTVSLSNTCNN